MTVYHGSSVEMRTPKIIRTEIGRDFGRAFCTEAAFESLAFVKSYFAGGR